MVGSKKDINMPVIPAPTQNRLQIANITICIRHPTGSCSQNIPLMMAVLDSINGRYGKDTLTIAAAVKNKLDAPVAAAADVARHFAKQV